MEERLAGYWTALLDRRHLVLVLAGLVAAALVPGLARLDTDNSPDVFFVTAGDDYAGYRDFVAEFGPDQTLRLVVEGGDLWSEQGLRYLARLEEGVTALPGVRRASGLAEHHRRFGWPPDDADVFRAKALDNAVDRAAGWIAADGQAASILVQVEKLEPAGRDALLRALDALIEDAPEDLAVRVGVLGLGVLNAELDRSSREIERLFFPLLIALTVLLLAVAVRNLRQILAPLIFVALCQVLTLGPMGYLGYSLNMVLAILPPIIFVISLATALHLVLRVRHVAESPDVSWADAASSVFANKGWAVFWTGVTTSAGFASLTVSEVAPVRDLGLWAAIGLVLTTVAAFTALPALIVAFGAGRGGAPAAGFERRVASWGSDMACFAVRHRAGILGVLAVISLLAVAGLPQLRIESNALRYLAPDHPLRTGIEDAERAGIGVAALELLVTVPPSGGGAPAPFVSALEVDRLADLASDIAKLDGVHGVLNAGLVLRDALRLVPQTPGNAHLRPQMALDGLAQDAQGRLVLDTLLSDDRQTARSTIFVATSGVDALDALDAHIRSQVTAYFPAATAEVTGEYRLLLLAQRSLIATLVLSLALTLVAVAIVLRFLLPSSRLTLLALMPNLWPVLGGLGLMGWVGVPLDIATVMMASVVLGLAVDDTIHTLGHFRRAAPVEGAEGAVERTLHATAPAYLLTGVILMAGFGVCGLSDFAPIARFGMLSSFSIGLAVLGDLFVLPALLSVTPDEVCDRLG